MILKTDRKLKLRVSWKDFPQDALRFRAESPPDLLVGPSWMWKYQCPWAFINTSKAFASHTTHVAFVYCSRVGLLTLPIASSSGTNGGTQ